MFRGGALAAREDFPIAFPYHILALPIILGWLIGEGLVALLSRLARSRGLLDHPTERGSHDTPTPRVGGIGFVAPCLLGASISGFVFPLGNESDPELILQQIMLTCALLAGGAAAFFVGLLDDLRGLGVAPKMLGQVVAACLVAWLVGGDVPLVFGALTFQPPAWAVFAGMALLCFWMMNVVNFMDGMDGMASTFGLFCLAGLGMTSVWAGSDAAFTPWFSWAWMLGGLIAFHRRNVTENRKTKVFMGDGGSLFLGLALTVLALGMARWDWEGDAVVIVPVILFFPFIFDTGLTMLRRLARGDNIFKAHHEHLYQRELDAGLTHREVRARWLVIFACHLVLLAAALALRESTVGAIATLAVTPAPMLCYWALVRAREKRMEGVGGD